MVPEERMRAVEEITELVNGRVPVVAHVACVSPTISAKLAKHAESCGCTGVSAVPSYYYKLTADQMYRYYEEIATASSLPFVIYAKTADYAPSVPMFEKLSQIPNVEGLKFTGSDHYMLGRIKEALGKDFMVYSGRDEMFLSGLLSGADGIIGGTYNVLPDLYIRGVKSFEAGNVKEAQKDMLAANAILEVMFPYDGSLAAPMRACYEFMGINAGRIPSPLLDLDKEQKEKLRADLKALKERLDIKPIALFEAL
jgi:N-acetylneuraminate lyase